MPRIRAWHATAKHFDQFAPFSHFGTRQQALMRMPPNGWLLEVDILICDPIMLKDTGSWCLKTLKRHAKIGYDSVQYLNRYEGIPIAAYERTTTTQARLRSMSDKNFRALLPEASDSWIVFNPAFVRTVARHQLKKQL